ncbi:uncharacterized protein LOC131736947 [Acipenser ruthenus]|uniref:uncharacterized protein LOC131736947 n=1 Tax=Acipenser ruthenus TaxID=7906 RepID=UPI002740A3C4|nr:uncharacterized protein LOC131736947 [Acipenser ruthenus]
MMRKIMSRPQSQSTLEEENTKLKETVTKLKKENEDLRSLNISLQKEFIQDIEKLLSKTKEKNKQEEQTTEQSTATTNLGISNAIQEACGRGGSSCTAMVKDLAVAVFGREVLSTHGLSGRAGNANHGSIAKPALDPGKIKLLSIDDLLILYFFAF